MKSYFCSQQNLVEAALQSGHWPEACDPALRQHVQTCASCSDLVLVAENLRQLRAEAMPAVRPPAPGILWWRAQLRRRNAALQSVAKPVAVVEKIAALILLLAVITVIVWQSDPIKAWLAGLWAPISSIAQIPVALLIGFGALVLFGGFAVYLLAAKD